VSSRPGPGELLIEWSAPPEADLDDLAGWRAASPHWTPRREKLIAGKLELMRAGEVADADEPDPEQSFRAQWLNQWPRVLTPSGNTEPLLPAGRWAELAQDVTSTGPIWVAVEDDYGLGAAVAACAQLEDGRLEVDGWLCHDWDAAIRDVQRLGEVRRIRQWLIGASLLNRVDSGAVPAPEPAGSRETRTGLALLRDLVTGGVLVHDRLTLTVDEALAAAKVRAAPSGLFLIPGPGSHLVKALVWAVQAAHKPAPSPVIY
jgi:hypothetical protein